MIQKLSLALVFFAIIGKAQDFDTHRSFVFTGINIDIPKNHSMRVLGGYSTQEHIHLTQVSPNLKINKLLSVSPTYTFMSAPLKHSMEYNLHIITPSATISLPLDKKYKWILQNQHTYLHIFPEKGNDTSFYKAKLGIIHRAKIFDKPTNFILSDEIYIALKGENGLTRNKLTAMVQVDLFKWLKPMGGYIFQSNRKPNGNDDHFFLAGVIFPLENYGFFKPKNNKK